MSRADICKTVQVTALSGVLSPIFGLSLWIGAVAVFRRFTASREIIDSELAVLALQTRRGIISYSTAVAEEITA